MRRLCIALMLVAGAAWGQDATYDAAGHRYFAWTTVGTNTWTPPFDASAGVLVVAGGGGSEENVGGAGGAGGLILTNISLSIGQTNSVIVGVGGTGNTDGSISQFTTNWIALGGAGGRRASGSDGGSGSGGWRTGVGGAGLQPASFSGGFGHGGGDGGLSSGGFPSGGGGGAGGVGGNANGSTDAGPGGVGINLSAWLNSLPLGDDGWFAGGGGGGTVVAVPVASGGKGGGGDGGNPGALPQNGMPNTGGGGGGRSESGPPTTGGSGIVIVRVEFPEDMAQPPLSPAQNAETRQAFTTFSWFPPLEGTPTNYLVHGGTSETNQTQQASTTETNATLDVRDFGAEPFTPIDLFWRVDVETASETVTGAVVQFEANIHTLGIETDAGGAEPKQFAAMWDAELAKFDFGPLAYDWSEMANHGTIVGGVTASTNAPVAGWGSAEFNGTGGYITETTITRDDFSQTNFTLEAWFRWTGGGGGSDGRNFVIENRGTTQFPLTLLASPSAANIQTAYRLAGREWEALAGGTLTSNQWTHAAATFNRAANSLTLFINGVGVATNSSVPAGHIESWPGGINIGTYRAADNRWFKGQISEVRIWNVARTASEIADNYTNRLTGFETGLVGYWPLSGVTE